MRNLVFFFLCTQILFAQTLNNKIVYLDSLKSETTNDDYKYYRIIEDYYLEKQQYLFTQYYRSDKIESQGKSIRKDFFMPNGVVNSFYENGSKKSVITYFEGNEDGKCEFWYENGFKKLDGEYILIKSKESKESRLKINTFWDKENNEKVSNGEGELIDNGEFGNFNSGSISKGKVKTGYKDGEWTGTNSKPTFSFIEFYDQGKLIFGTSKDSLNIEYNYNAIQIAPKINGGMEKFYKYVQKNFNPPDDLLSKGGKVLTRFVIDKEGNIIDLVTTKSLRKDVDEQVILMLSKFKGFSPAQKRGIKVNCSYVLPLSIAPTIESTMNSQRN